MILIFAMVWTHSIWAQESEQAGLPEKALADAPSSAPILETASYRDKAPHIFQRLLLDFGEDQKQIWTSPARVRLSDATWLVPLGGLTAGLFATDRQYSASLSNSASTINHYKTVSNAGIAGLVGASAGMYLMSFPSHNEHWRETGFLAGEAAINSLIPIEIMKYSLGRERPFQGAGGGRFFRGGTSFPSEHSAAAWSIAGVIAHEYPGVVPRLVAYGTAAAIDFSRIHGRQHFPSDVLVGSVLGYLVAQSIYTRRHDPELRGAAWDQPSEFVDAESHRSPAFMGSPYVPLDSWIYPAMERLAAMGYVKTGSLGLRPWTRLECARLVIEASDLQAAEDGPPQAQEMYESLSKEFAHEFSLMSGDQNLHAQLESTYIRSTGISGTPLTDNQHFGQTILNDYGRPYQEGFNSVAGISGWTSAGPFVIYARGEYQSSPSAPSPSPAALDYIQSIDSLPPNPPLTPVNSIGRLRVLDAYVGMNLANWQISFGKQSLWWGPSADGPMLATNNTEPINNMFRVSRVSPFRLPWIFRYFGDMRVELFLGQLSGQEFLKSSSGIIVGQYGETLRPQPFIEGAKISFKFTPNLEFNMSKTTIYGGPGNPLTPTTLFKSALGLHVNGEALGDGRAAWDFTYRVPKMRDWLTLYGDIFEEDEPFPINHLGKAAFQGGLYFAKLPKISRLDLRLEGGSTSPVNFSTCNGCYYHNFQYVNGYTNNGELLGSWLGRTAQGEALSSTYWFSAQKKVSVELRHRKVDRQALPQGGTQNDAAFKGEFSLKSGFRFSGTLQYESWQIPLLAATRQSNVTASFQFSFWPRVRSRAAN